MSASREACAPGPLGEDGVLEVVLPRHLGRQRGGPRPARRGGERVRRIVAPPAGRGRCARLPVRADYPGRLLRQGGTAPRRRSPGRPRAVATATRCGSNAAAIQAHLQLARAAQIRGQAKHMRAGACQALRRRRSGQGGPPRSSRSVAERRTMCGAASRRLRPALRRPPDLALGPQDVTFPRTAAVKIQAGHQGDGLSWWRA